MTIKKSQYEELLSAYSNREEAIALLRQHRPYLEMIPSLRRADESLITIPLPVVNICHPKPTTEQNLAYFQPDETVSLPCDVAILMCDPEWKIKMGVEILVYIHSPQEDFSNLLRRWRSTQVYLSKDYQWTMPMPYEHILSEAAEQVYPLFVVFADTPERIKRGLQGASLPFVTYQEGILGEEEIEDWHIEVEG